MKKYRVGVIGRTGRGDYGHGLDRVWLEVPEAEIVAVADDNPAGLAAAAKRLKAPKAYPDYRKMLDEARPDVVSICPRWIDQHRDMACACAERGIHMYLEKPFCRTLAEADEIVAACERTHTLLAIAHQTRYSPKLAVAQQMIASGRIGRPLELRGRGKEDARGGGEDLWVLGSHIMDLIRTLGGQPQSCLAQVTVQNRSITPADVVEGREGIGPLAGDAVRAMYVLPNDVTGYFNSVRGAGSKSSRFGLQIFGSAGVLEIGTGYLPPLEYLDDPSWSPGRSGRAWQDVSSAGVGQKEPLEDRGHAMGNLLAVRDLLSAIEGGRQPVSNMYEARGALEMIVAVFASQQADRGVELPLAERDNPLSRLKA